MLSDLMNGGFEFFGACTILLSLRKLLADKEVKGIHWGQVLFFWSWGVFNTYYYPHLHQWWSFGGGLFVLAVNSVYFFNLVKFSHITDSWKGYLTAVGRGSIFRS